MQIEALTVYPTKHGIDTTPSPKFVKSVSVNIKRIDQWMIDNALRISKQTRNEHMEIMIKCMDITNMSTSDRDTLNDYLWNFED